jgi:hypothetical protein
MARIVIAKLTKMQKMIINPNPMNKSKVAGKAPKNKISIQTRTELSWKRSLTSELTHGSQLRESSEQEIQGNVANDESTDYPLASLSNLGMRLRTPSC